MPCLKDLIIERFQTKVRIGYPQGIMRSQNNNLELVTSLGVIDHVNRSLEDIEGAIPHKENLRGIKQYINWIKQNIF